MVDQEMLDAMSEITEQRFAVMSEMMEQRFAVMSEMMEQKFAVMSEKTDQKLTEMSKKTDEKLTEMEERQGRKLDEKLQPIYDRLDSLESNMKYVRVIQLENNVIPRLNTIEACYVDTARRYSERIEQIDTMGSDIGVLKVVVQNHSEKLNRISV